jgi:hypothetical protein
VGRKDVDLMPSDGDKAVLELFGQKNSIIYNSVARNRLINEEDK